MKVIDGNKLEHDVEEGTLEELIKIQADPISKQRFNEAKNEKSNRAINPESFQPVILYGGKAYSLEAMLDWKAEGVL